MRTAPKRSGRSSWRSRGASVALLLAAAGSARAQEARGRVAGERVFPAVIYADDLPDETAAPPRALEASRAGDLERSRGADGRQDRGRVGPVAAPAVSIRWFRSLRTEGTVLLLALVFAVELAYAYAALSALRETTDRVASE